MSNNVTSEWAYKPSQKDIKKCESGICCEFGICDECSVILGVGMFDCCEEECYE